MAKKPKYPDAPFKECAETADKIIKEIPQALVFQKFWCENCKQRVSMNNPNVFTHYGHCENCNHITNILENGCNYRVEIPNATTADMKTLLRLTGRTATH